MFVDNSLTARQWASSRFVVRPLGHRAQTRRGQTIVVALLTLILLAFTGIVFITIVTRNLQNTGRAQKTTVVDYYAQAGLRFADMQLTTSPDGADWRPPVAVSPSVKDPDYTLLTQGFSRYNFGRGRFLVRLTYNPAAVGANGALGPSDPLGRFIKIESIGRDGNVDPTDPTTFHHGPYPALNQTLVGYKAIGITDFARFETNPEKRSEVMNIGVPSVNKGTSVTDITTPGVDDWNTASNSPATKQFPLVSQLGSPDAYLKDPTSGQLLPNPNAGLGAPPTGYTTVAGGGSFFANGSVRFYGPNLVYLNRPAAGQPAYDESVQVAGSVFLENFNPDLAAQGSGAERMAQSSALAVNDGSNTLQYARPSNYADKVNPTYMFDTLKGAVRDGQAGSSVNDINGYPRAVNRIEPPSLDATDPGSHLTRYRTLGQNSPARFQPGTTTPFTIAQPGQNGFGQVIYVNNTTDLQRQSTGITGGYTLVDDWLHRTNNGWTGDFYNPPGVDINFTMISHTVAGGTKVEPAAVLARSDTDAQGNPQLWPAANGLPASRTMTVFFSDLGTNTTNANHDVVIYAEGNVRAHGIVSGDPADTHFTGNSTDTTPWHVTVVTNGTAYIEGNLLKGNPKSSIAVLAHDYVCVNTTQFFAGKQPSQPVDPATGSPVTAPGAYSGNPDVHALTFDPNIATEELLQEFTFGVTNGQGPSSTSKLALYVSGGTDGGGPATVQYTFFNSVLSPNSTLTTQTYGPSANAAAVGGSLVRTTVPLTLTGQLFENDFSTLSVQMKPGNADVNTGDFILERIAILPGDVRIEAVLFAQTQSFFVIPGPWFNSDSGDNLNDYINPNAATGQSTPHGLAGNQPDLQRFPFYGQPPDMKVTIYGTVAEARPADISAEQEWMRHWGWIPQYHGSLHKWDPATEPAGHLSATAGMPAPGLTIVYDPMAAYPYATANGSGQYLRADASGRALPFAPKLPVCGGLLYSGQSSEQSLFQ